MSTDTTIDGVARPGKDELLARVASDRTAWLELIDRAGDRTGEPGAAGHWTLRDVVAHINAYHRFLVSSLGGRARGFGDMPADVGDDVQKRNEWMHEQDLDRSWESVMEEGEELHRELVARVEARSPEQLAEPMVDWNPWPTWRWIVELTHGHYEEHLPDLRRWLASGQGGPAT